MSSPDPVTVARLWGRTPDSMEPAAAGANGVVYHLRSGGDQAALKHYRSRPGDGRDRLGTETRAARFMAANGLDAVARVIDASPDDGLALFEWLTGQPVARPEPKDIEAAVLFAAAVADLSDRPGAESFAPASEACPSPGAILAQLADRRRVLDRSAERDGDLAELLRQNDAVTETVADTLAAAYGAKGWHFDAPLARGKQRLIPADFGFHNTLREPNGRLRFFDFEYFGWDDPVKLIADLILHPAYSLDDTGRAQIRALAADRFSRDTDFNDRLAILLPAFAMRWALIVLNPLRPEQYETGAETEGWAALRADRLEKARLFLDLAGFCLRTL